MNKIQERIKELEKIITDHDKEDCHCESNINCLINTHLLQEKLKGFKEALKLKDEELKTELCKDCGFPLNWERSPVFLKNDIFSYIDYEKNTCQECGHQKDGYTLKKIEPLLRKFRDAGYKKANEELKEKIDEFKKKIKINGNLAYRIIETEGGDFKNIRDDALKIIVLEIFTEIFSEEKA